MNVKLIAILLTIVLAGVALYAIVLPMFERGEEVGIEAVKTISLYSPAFKNGSYIPKKYALEGEDLSPPLEWSNIPEGTISYVLLVIDPDAPMGPFTHWVLYNIPATITRLPEGVPKTLKVEGVGLQGYNDYGRIGYGGPHPPKGSTHRYIFRIYALDTFLELEPGAKLREVLRAMEGHVLGYGELVGLYSR